MYAYLIRRLLWMIPTIIVILMVTFGVMRLQSLSLADTMSSGPGEEGGDRDSRTRVANVRNYLGKFIRTGNHLPALLNTRFMIDKEEMLALLQQAERAPEKPEAKRNRDELAMWTGGRFYVAPLLEILRDDNLKEYHGPASQAISMCAYIPPHPEIITDADRRSMLSVRNKRLESNLIAYQNDSQKGYVLDESVERVAKKREQLYELLGEAPEFQPISGLAVVPVMFFETGFIDLMGKLFSGTLYSYGRNDLVFNIIAERWYVTFWLNIIAIILAWAISIPLGIRAARKAGTLEERATSNGLLMLWSIPEFFVGTLFLLHLCSDSSYSWHLFPNKGLTSDDTLWMSGWELFLDMCWHGFLPLLVLSYNSFTVLSRYMRGQMLGELQADYVRTARAKGVHEDRIIYGHALRNSMITMITLGAGLLSALFGGFVFVEFIFSIQGLGTLLIEAAINQDAPLIMGSTVVSVGLLLAGILLADILYAVADPRIRNQYD